MKVASWIIRDSSHSNNLPPVSSQELDSESCCLKFREIKGHKCLEDDEKVCMS